MAGRRNPSNNDDQLGLALTGEGFQGPAEPHGLLSSAYLSRHLRESPQFWQKEKDLAGFWAQVERIGDRTTSRYEMREAQELSDTAFCQLCQDLLHWFAKTNQTARPHQRISKSALGLHSSEEYSDPSDAPRIATIYNGLYGRAQFVPFRKGDPEGSRWLDNEPLFCDWSRRAVEWLSSSPDARWQGHRFFLSSGVTWTAVANHVALKARFQDSCVFDADSMRLTPIFGTMPAETFVSLLNSDVFSYFKMRFMQHTQKWEIGNLRQMPIIMPDKIQKAMLSKLAALAMAAKRHEFAGTAPDDELVSQVREIGATLRQQAPVYLRPSAQGLLLVTPVDCLEVIEKAVNWEAEKLYGVEGKGPFDEF